ALFRYQVWVNQEMPFGFRGLPAISPHRAWLALQDNPTLFTKTPAQVVAAENFRLNASEHAAEEVSAAYVQTEARFFNNRLNLLAGVRFEHTHDEGQGLLLDPNA